MRRSHSTMRRHVAKRRSVLEHGRGLRCHGIPDTQVTVIQTHMPGQPVGWSGVGWGGGGKQERLHSLCLGCRCSQEGECHLRCSLERGRLSCF